MPPLFLIWERSWPPSKEQDFKTVAHQKVREQGTPKKGGCTQGKRLSGANGALSPRAAPDEGLASARPEKGGPARRGGKFHRPQRSDLLHPLKGGGKDRQSARSDKKKENNKKTEEKFHKELLKKGGTLLTGNHLSFSWRVSSPRTAGITLKGVGHGEGGSLTRPQLHL